MVPRGWPGFPKKHVGSTIFNWKGSIQGAPFSLVSKANDRRRKQERIIEWEIRVNQGDEICEKVKCLIPEYLVMDVIIILIITFLRSLKIREFLVQPGQDTCCQDNQHKLYLGVDDSLRVPWSVASMDIRRGKCRLFKTSLGLLLSSWTQKALRITRLGCAGFSSLYVN